MTEYLVRSHERMDYKRCPKKWYWAWRRGLVPKAKSFGALDLGAWFHDGLAYWYGLRGTQRLYALKDAVKRVAVAAIESAAVAGAPSIELNKANELMQMAIGLAEAYEAHYGNDPDVYVLATEQALDFSFNLERGGLVRHMLKPDLIFRDKRTGKYWLMEHKTAASIQTEHLALDDQARPYVVMAERGLRKLGMLAGKALAGIRYNYIRKALPDTRPMNNEGHYLNKDGSVSKKQPSAYFVRYDVKLTNPAKVQTLQRISDETALLALMTKAIREKEIEPARIPKTPHKSCPRFCQFFTMCVAEENGVDIREMQRELYVRRNPYEYPETAEDHKGFE